MKMIKMVMIASAIFVASLASCAGNRIFDSLPKTENLSVVYISKPMMHMGMTIASRMDPGMVDMLKSVKNAGGTEVVTAESPETIKMVKDLTESKIKELRMELLMNSQDGEETVNIYTGKSKDESLICNMMVVSEEPGEYNVVYIFGEIDPSEIIND